MKRMSLFLGLIISIAVYSQPAQQNRVPLTKMQMSETWKSENIKMISLESKGTGTAQQVVAERALYEIIEKLKTDALSALGPLAILKIHAVPQKKYAFIDPDHSFYVADDSGVRGYTVGPGVLIWSGSYFEVSDSASRDTAIHEFEWNFDRRKFNREWDKRGNINRIDLNRAASKYYFSDAPAPGGATPLPKVLSADITNNVLHLDMENPVTKIPATFFIDLKAKKVIKSVVNGEEMDLSVIGSGRRYASPKK